MNRDSYKTIQSASEGFFKDKNSKFYAFAFPVENEADVESCRAMLKKKFYDSRHQVYAFRLGADAETFRASDDGEPSNSSGPPVLGKIKSYDLTNILIVVVRYFGGTKLGIPGLINAYGTAAEEAIKNAKIIEKTIYETLNLGFEYPEMNDVMRIIKDNNLEILHQDMQLSCKMTIGVPRSKFLKIKDLFERNYKLKVR